MQFPNEMKQFWLTAKEVLEVVLIAVATVIVIRHFIVQPFLVSGASMEPNFSDGNYLLIDEVTYRFRPVAHGEVVVFRYPQDRKTFFIKRLIGLPGDHVIVHNSEVFVNGNRLNETYLDKNILTGGEVDVRLKDGEYFVLGDNRAHSFDSRNWGPIMKDDIIGLVRLRVLPINQINAFSY